jgi:hypothetical protein
LTYFKDIWYVYFLVIWNTFSHFGYAVARKIWQPWTAFN